MMKKGIIPKISTKSTLVIILLLALIIRLVFFQGTDTSDSLRHTKYAYDISRGVFPTDSNQGNFRIGLLVPVSFLYSVFGINEFTSAFFPLAMSLFGIVLIFLLGKLLFSEKVGLIAAFLMSIFPLDVLYATRFMSDLPSAVFSGLSIYLFLKAEKLGKSAKTMVLYTLAGISLGISFSVREMAIVTFLFYIAYAVFNKRLKMSYSWIGIGFLSIFVIELLFFYAHTGDPFYRFTSLTEGGNYVERAKFHDFYGRLSFPKFFLTWVYVIFGNFQQGIFFTFISVAIIYWIFYRTKNTTNMLIWFLSVSLYLYFGSTSLTTYEPVLAVARYLSYVVLPGLLLLAAFLVKEKNLVKKAILPFSLIFLFVSSVWVISLDESRHSLDILRETYSYVQSTDKPIYTDRRSILALDYISGYGGRLNLIDLDSNPKNIRNIEDAYIVINNQFIIDLNAIQHDLVFSDELTEIPKNWVNVKVIGKTEKNVTIYFAEELKK